MLRGALAIQTGGRLIFATLTCLLAAAAPWPPARLAPAAADSIRGAIEKDRAETGEWLKSAPNSYLAAVDRRDFGDRRSLTVGRVASNDVRIDDEDVTAHHLRVTVDGDSFRVEAADAAATFKLKDQEVREAVVGPSAVQVGRFTLRLSHQRFPAIIVFDPRSPRFKEYRGLRYFPVDLAYRFELPLATNPTPDTTVILSTRGNQRRAVRAGWFHFTVRGKTCRLEAVRLLEPGVGESDVSVYFRDATSGKESYGLGRYVEAEPLPGGRYVLDFNRAYNPACAFSPHYNCPIPPRANTLKVAIRAGERDARTMEHEPAAPR